MPVPRDSAQGRAPTLGRPCAHALEAAPSRRQERPRCQGRTHAGGRACVPGRGCLPARLQGRAPAGKTPARDLCAGAAGGYAHEPSRGHAQARPGCRARAPAGAGWSRPRTRRCSGPHPRTRRGGAVAEDRSATGAGLGITRMHGRLRRLAGVARPSRHGGRAPGTPNRRSAARPRPIQRRPGSRLAPPPRVPRAEAAPACVAEPRARAGPLRPPVVEGPRRARPRAVAAPPPGPRPGGPRRGQAEPPGPTAAAPLPAHAAGTRPPCPCSPAVATRRC